MLRCLLIVFLLFISGIPVFAQAKKEYNNLLKTDTLLIPVSKKDIHKYKERLPVVIDSGVYHKRKPAAVPAAVVAPVSPVAAIQGNVSLVVHISMERETVADMHDLKLFITITNKSYRAQRFLFDRPARASGGIWATQCMIFNAAKESVLQHPFSITPETKTYTPAELIKYEYSLGAGEWLMKAYPVNALVTYNAQFMKNGKLLPGRYSLQLNIYGNVSNTVSFTVR